MLKKLIPGVMLSPWLLFVVWAALSLIDIAADNTGAAVHSKYNLFVLCLEVFGK